MNADGAPPPESNETYRTLIESKRHVLLEDADGYSLWNLKRDDEDPIAMFPATEEGLEDAFARWDAIRKRERRGSLLTVLAWVAGVLGCLWIVLTLFVIVLGLVTSYTQPEPTDDRLSWFYTLFAYPFFSFMPTAFLAAAGTYVVVWMQFRRADR